jgi:hypothetical protein
MLSPAYYTEMMPCRTQAVDRWQLQIEQVLSIMEVEVNAGVKNGDQLILQPPVNLADGDKVHVLPQEGGNPGANH